MFAQTLIVAQGVAVLIIYVISWNAISATLTGISGTARTILAVLLIAFMYATSNYSFQFAKDWGI